MPVRDAPARWAAAPRHYVRMQELVSLSRRCITRAPHLSPRPATTQREPTPVAYCPEVWSLDVEPRCGVARVERSTMHCLVLSSGLREKKTACRRLVAAQRRLELAKYWIAEDALKHCYPPFDRSFWGHPRPRPSREAGGEGSSSRVSLEFKGCRRMAWRAGMSRD